MLRSGPARNSRNAIRADCKMEDSGHEPSFFKQDEFIVAILAGFVGGNVDVDFLAPLPDFGIHKSVPELGFLD